MEGKMKKEFGILKGLKGKILILVCLPLFMMVIVALVILNQLHSISENNTVVLQNTVPSLTTSKEIQIEIVKIDSALEAAGLLKEKDDIQLKTSDVESSIERVNSAYERYNNLNIKGKAIELRKKSYELWKKSEASLISTIKVYSDGDFAKAKTSYESSIKDELASLKDLLLNIELNNQDVIEQEINIGKQTYKDAVRNALIGLLMGILFSGLLSYFLSSRLSKNLTELSAQLETESQSTRSEVKTLVSSSDSLAQLANSAASAVEQTTASIDRVKSMIERNLENTLMSTKVSNESVKTVDLGKESLTQVEGSFDDLLKAKDQLLIEIKKNNEQFKYVFNIINSISSKTALIDDIVMQTKLLSFNASVEAARAGEQGKGFVVVSEEIGNLARTSGSASKEISELLTQSKQETEKILAESVKNMSQVAENIESKILNSRELVKTSIDAFEAIAEKTSEVSRLAHDVSSSAKDEVTSVTEISKAVDIINQTSHRNKLEGEEIAKSAANILLKSESVDEIVKSLKEVVRGQNSDDSQANNINEA